MQVKLVLPCNWIVDDFISDPLSHILQSQSFLQSFVNMISSLVDEEFPIGPFGEVLANVTDWDEYDERIFSGWSSTVIDRGHR